MRLNGIFYIVLSTVVLVALAVMAFYNLSFSLIFYTTIGGQILLIYTVYKVLTDDYKTDKTFEDWYEDYPIGKDN